MTDELLIAVDQALAAAATVLVAEITNCQSLLKISDKSRQNAAISAYGARFAWRYFLTAEFRALEHSLAKVGVEIVEHCGAFVAAVRVFEHVPPPALPPATGERS